MQIYIAILRGINVSGKKKIYMKDLLSYMEEIGLKDVKTYIQSGNLVFRSERNSNELINIIQNKIEIEYDFFVPVIILTGEEIEKIIKQNPYKKLNIDIKNLYFTFLSEYPENVLIGNIKDQKHKDDEFIISGKIIYVYCPGGYGKTKFTNKFFERKLNVSASTRNWKTTVKLQETANEL